MRLSQKHSPILVKNEARDSIRDNFEYSGSSKYSSKKATENTPASHSANEIFKNKNKKKKGVKPLESRPAYSSRDLEIDLLGLAQFNRVEVSSNAIFFSLLQKFFSLILFALIIITASFYTYEKNQASSSIILITAFVSLLALFIYNAACSFLERRDPCNHSITNNNQELLHSLCNILASKFETKIDHFNFSLKPDIKIISKNDSNHIYIGLPLLHTFTYQELTCLLVFKLYKFKALNDHKALKSLNESNTHTSFSSIYPALKAINISAFRASIETTNIDIFTSTFTKLNSFEAGFNLVAKQLKQKQSIPMNLITQIVCASTSSSVTSLEKTSSFSKIPESLLNKHKSSLHLNFKAYFLLQNSNALANEISTTVLSRFNFSSDQLTKTHKTHNAFPSFQEQDPIQYYYNSTYRLNRTINPNIEEGSTGSLLMLKANILELNQLLLKQKNNHDSFLSNWDQFKSPHILKGVCPKISALDLELGEYENLMSLKTGLCIAIILNVGNADEQKDLYSLLDARRKTALLNRAMDTIINCLNTELDSSYQLKETSVPNKTRALLQLCAQLPEFNAQIEPNLPLFAREILNRDTEINDNAFTRLQALKLIQHIDDYKWALENQLILACEKVENRILN